jgi:zinc/manganese transport system permease protein
MTTEGLQVGILLPAFAAGLLVLLTHVPLGMEVLRRGIIFIDLAVAQFAGFGIVAAHALGADSHGWHMQLAALAAALVGGLFLHWREKRSPANQEAIIGVSFVAVACATIWANLVPLALVSAVLVTAWHGFRLKASPLAFYLVFAIAITASVQVVGVYLVFASLIVPALAARGRWWRAYMAGATGYAAGLLASALLDLPSGAAIVLALVLAALVVSLATRAPRHAA